MAVVMQSWRVGVQMIECPRELKFAARYGMGDVDLVPFLRSYVDLIGLGGMG